MHLTEGFDFLGVNVRRYPGGKLLIKPSKAAVRRLRERLAAETRALRGANAVAVIARLSPITRGWAAYYRTVVSAEVFSALDHYVWKLTYKWASIPPPEQAEALGRRPVLRQVQQVQERPLGVRRPRQRRPTWSSSPGPASSGMSWSKARRPPTTPPWPTTGPVGDGAANPRWTATPCACSPGRTGAARSAGTTCSPPTSHRSPRSSGNDGGFRSPARR